MSHDFEQTDQTLLWTPYKITYYVDKVKAVLFALKVVVMMATANFLDYVCSSCYPLLSFCLPIYLFIVVNISDVFLKRETWNIWMFLGKYTPRNEYETQNESWLL